MNNIVEGDFCKEIALFSLSAFEANVNMQTVYRFAEETERRPNLTGSTEKSDLCHGG